MTTGDKYRPLWAFLLLSAGCSPELGSRSGRAAGEVQVAISGEQIATDGIAFPSGSEVTFVDGWSIEFSHVLVTIDDVTLAENPDRSPSDQSQTGRVVARARGPWAVDLHVPGTIPGAAGEGLSTPLVRIANQTERGAAAFSDTDRYAFGYQIVAASADAARLNFQDDAETQAAYTEMIESGASVLYIGVARFVGASCASSDPAYDFDRLPREVPFRLAFRSPTSFINCQNQDNQGQPLPDEAYQRGIAIAGNAEALAQITLHLEHVWFSATAHDPPLRFDPIAARLVGKPTGSVVGLDDLALVDPTAFTDAGGASLAARSCDGSPLPPGKRLQFYTGSVPVDPGAKPADALRDYRDFIQYVQSTQGHLNGGDGLCFVQRNYPSPP